MPQKPDNTKIPDQGDQDLKTLLDNYPGAAYRCLNDGNWTAKFVSAGIHDLTGYRPEQFLSCEINLNDIIHPDDREHIFQQVQDAIAAREYFQFEYRIRTADGQEKWVWEQGCGVFNAAGELLMLEGFVNDITERKQTEQQLALLVFALNHVHEAAYLIDEHARFLYVNHEACRALGYSRDELLHMGIEDIDPGYSMELWEAHWGEIRNKGALSLETTHQRKDGHVFPVEISANYFEYNDREYDLALARDITSRKEQEARIQHLAYHDALTDLPNRNLSLDRLVHAMSYAKRHGQTLAILFVDLDNFKIINDTMGHPVGDELLRQVGGRLSGTLREQDTIGRLGGDEFIILLPELSSPQDAAHVTEKILAALTAPFDVTSHSLHVTASAGISLYPRDASDANTLVKYADTALYLAKDQGRNTFKFFSPELDQKIHDRLHMENDLRQAIKNNEFLLHYQPQFNLDTGVMTGVEALLRWQHPVRGLIPPGDFIPLAEDIGLIIPLGEWVLRTASAQARAWQEAGISSMRVCINISQRQLAQHDFPDDVHRILNETGCDPHIVELEITESCVMDRPDHVIAKLQALHEMGIRLALDDFGTGYSSLGYLKRFPLDRLKIDRSFVAGLPEDSSDIAIVQTTIVLARHLGLSVVAEGVETEAQQRLLKAYGCHEMQGFLLSKPLPAEELEKIFE